MTGGLHCSDVYPPEPLAPVGTFERDMQEASSILHNSDIAYDTSLDISSLRAGQKVVFRAGHMLLVCEVQPSDRQYADLLISFRDEVNRYWCNPYHKDGRIALSNAKNLDIVNVIS